MSNDLEFRVMARKKKKKQKRKKTFIAICAIILVLLTVLVVVKVFSSLSGKNIKDAEFIFNGYVYPLPEEKDCDLLNNLHSNDGVKSCYLTFDDGPDKTSTVEILETLRRYNVKATFFTLGTLIEENPQIARRIFDEGHLIANHSYSHNYTELYESPQAFMNQTEKNYELIKNITQISNYPKIVRFPGGGANAGKYGEMKQTCKALLKEAGYKYCDWNVLSGDSEGVDTDKNTIISNIKNSVKGKEDIVILMHDAPSKTETVNALPAIIELLISEGYEFDTLDNI